jgi:hypothetical protein
VKDLALLDVYGRVARLLLNLSVEKDGKLRHSGKDYPAGNRRARRRLARHGEQDLPRPLAGGYISVENRFITINKKPPRGGEQRGGGC